MNRRQVRSNLQGMLGAETLGGAYHRLLAADLALLCPGP